MTTATTAAAPEFDDNRKARDRQFVDALLEGCSTGEAARRAGSKASSEDGLRATGSRWLKLESVQRLLLELGAEDTESSNGSEPLAGLAESTLRAIIEDDNSKGTVARVRACEIVLKRDEKQAQLRAKARGVEIPSDLAQEQRRTIILEAARGVLLASTPAVRAEFFRGIDLEAFGDALPVADDAEPTDPEPKQ